MEYSSGDHLCCFVRSVHFHLPVEAVVQEEVVSHPHTMRLHRVTLKKQITNIIMRKIYTVFGGGRGEVLVLLQVLKLTSY